MTHTVYRFYDVLDQLLYVGVTTDLKRRCQEHSPKFWWPEVFRTVTVQLEDRDEALAMEAAAICDEDPVYNVMGRRSDVVWDAGMSEQPTGLAAMAAAGAELKTARLRVKAAMKQAKKAALEAIDGGMYESYAAGELGLGRNVVRRWQGKE